MNRVRQCFALDCCNFGLGWCGALAVAKDVWGICWCWPGFCSGGVVGRWAIILWGLRTFLIIPNFLKS